MSNLPKQGPFNSIVIILLMIFSSGMAQGIIIGPNYTIESDVLSAGGGISSSDQHILTATIGQASGIGSSSNSSYSNQSGFWPQTPAFMNPAQTQIATFDSFDVPKVIPDGNAEGVSSTINVPGSCVISDIDIHVQAEHTFVGDLTFTITHNGKSATIIDRAGEPASTYGCEGDDIDAVLDDEAVSPVESQCAGTVPSIDGTFSPNESLSVFDGEDAAGTWTLTVSDFMFPDSGSLTGWGITLTCVGQSIRYVVPGGASTGPCASWETACDLQYALNSAPSDTEIWVQTGTYKPTSGTDRTATFQLKGGVAIYGGFSGTETSRAQRDIAANVTTLSGDIGEIGNLSDNSYHVVTGSGTANSAILDGFTVSGGNADGSDPDYSGGGMYNNAGSPTIQNVTFSGNTAAAYGGGMLNLGSSPGISNVTFSGNTAGFYGGGVENMGSSSPTFTNVTFWGNAAMEGGGMDTDTGSPILINVTISGNTATGSGGGMSTYAGSPQLKNTIVWGNSAPGAPQIYNYPQATVEITYSIVQGGCPGNATCSNLVTSDPTLDPAGLKYNGGPTQTLALFTGSSGIDAGNNGTCASTDQRGIARPQGNACDIGAYEARLYEITVAATGINGGTIASGSMINATWDGTTIDGDNTETVSEGTGPYIITANAHPGITVSWSGDCDSKDGGGTASATCTINPPVASHKHVSARFVAVNTTVKSSADVPKEIPDGNAQGVSSTLEVSDSCVISDLDVSVQIAHTWVSDLKFTLTHNGKSAVIIDRPGYPESLNGCMGDNIDAVLDDEAGVPVEGACAESVPSINGIFSPNESLSVFDGEDAAGTWTLTGVDFVAPDSGSLTNWSLTLTCLSLFNVSFSVTSGDGSISCTRSSVSQGESFECTLFPSSGWHFATLTDNGGDVTSLVNGNTYSVSNVTSDHTIHAVFNQNLVLRRSGSNEIWHTSVQTAYNVAGNGDMILSRAIDFGEDLLFNREISVLIEGGYDPDFNFITGFTTVHGSLEIRTGTVEVDNLILE